MLEDLKLNISIKLPNTEVNRILNLESGEITESVIEHDSKVYSFKINKDTQEIAILNNVERLEHSFEAFVSGVAEELWNETGLEVLFYFHHLSPWDLAKAKKKIKGEIKYYLHGINFKTENHAFFKTTAEKLLDFYILADEYIMEAR